MTQPSCLSYTLGRPGHGEKGSLATATLLLLVVKPRSSSPRLPSQRRLGGFFSEAPRLEGDPVPHDFLHSLRPPGWAPERKGTGQPGPVLHPQPSPPPSAIGIGRRGQLRQPSQPRAT